jgi:putative permease
MINMLRDWFRIHFSDPQIIILWFFLISGFLIIYIFGEMLTPVFAGLIVAYLLEGIVGMLEKIKIPRLISVLLTFIFFMICMVLLIIWLLPLLSQQIGQLIQDLPAMITSAQILLLQLPERYPEFISDIQIREFIVFLKSELTQMGQSALIFSLASVKNLITLIVYLLIVPFLILFFLKDKVLILQWISGFLPDNRDLSTEVWREVNRQIANYIRGKIWEIIIVWCVTFVTFSLLDLNYAMLLGFFTGLSVLIPYIGASVMYLPVGLIAFFQWGIGPQFMYVIIAYSVIQMVDGNILVPLLFSEIVNLHPVAIIVAVLIFGGFWGIWGLFFAIPLATLFHVVLKVWFSKRQTYIKESLQNVDTN